MSDHDDYARGMATGYGNNFWSHQGAMEQDRAEREKARRQAREARDQEEKWAAERGGAAGAVTATPPTPAEPGILDDWYARLDALVAKLPRWVSTVFILLGTVAGGIGGAAMGMEGWMLLLAAFGGAGLGAAVIPVLTASIKIAMGLALLSLVFGALYLVLMALDRMT